MKGIARLLMVLAALSPLSLSARGIADIIEGLSAAPAYNASVTYSVTLPSRDDDVVYRLNLSSVPTPADTLSPCAYLIGWQLDTPSGPTEGWTSYFTGNLYRYRDHRLREYHTSWDPAPFMPATASRRQPGVQEATQFVELLPAYIARDLRAMAADTLYTLSEPKETTLDGRPAMCLEAVMDVRGERVRQASYWFDRDTHLPLRIDIESNPASITEQTITVNYAPAPDADTPMSEESLLALYPEHFEKYRESNFRIENLRDTPLPTFTLPTATGERYAHQRGQAFRAPTVVALLDPDTSFSSDIVRDLRAAIDSSTIPADIIWAVTGTNADRAEELVGQTRPGEHLLLNARSLARDCGASSLPVVILAAPSGMVKNVLLGYNSDLSTVVLQSIALL
ncbi:hypothetical protein [Duncaniella muricolitica]|uniref:hypothetical protein n=1 Tax=Duncaniella muricolitica TaxID=2880704 RepID=UPI00244E4E8B|nr:hypothetical protein [Duncaniella muricolitica]